MAAWLRTGVLALILMVLAAAPAGADTRIALVIGNGAYANVRPLANTVNDGRSVAQTLRNLGYGVTETYDQGRGALGRSLQAFGQAAANADVVVIYYAGHGMQVQGQNYLIPVDATLKTSNDVDIELIRLDALTKAAAGARRFGVVMIDACRDNPFAARMAAVGGATRSVSGGGLAEADPQGNMLIVYAAKAGTTADDGTDGHSPFAKAVVARIRADPTQDVRFLFGGVRKDVLKETNQRQQPNAWNTLDNEPYRFVDGPPGAQLAVATPGRTPSGPSKAELDLAARVQESLALATFADQQAQEQAKAAKAAQASALQAVAAAKDAAARADRGEAGYGVVTGTATGKAFDGSPLTWRYAGQVVNGKPHGYGEQRIVNGDLHTGQWQDGAETGFGSIVYRGQRFDGKRINGGFVLSVTAFPDGDVYAGSVTNGRRLLGVYTSGPSKRFSELSGQWGADGFLGGYGIAHLRTPPGGSWAGGFLNGVLSGPGATYDGDEAVIAQGLFNKGQLVSPVAQAAAAAPSQVAALVGGVVMPTKGAFAPQVAGNTTLAGAALRDAIQKAADATAAMKSAEQAAAAAKDAAARAERGQAGYGVLNGAFGGTPGVTWRYAGQVADGKPNGYGEQTWSNGGVRAGQWQAGQQTGFGFTRYPNGAEFRGKAINGRVTLGANVAPDQNGFMGEFAGDGSWSVGLFSGDAKRPPRGGQFRSGRLNGYGALFGADNKTYLLGLFADDALTGPGALMNDKGEIVQQGLYEQSKLVTPLKR